MNNKSNTPIIMPKCTLQDLKKRIIISKEKAKNGDDEIITDFFDRLNKQVEITKQSNSNQLNTKHILINKNN